MSLPICNLFLDKSSLLLSTEHLQFIAAETIFTIHASETGFKFNLMFISQNNSVFICSVYTVNRKAAKSSQVQKTKMPSVDTFRLCLWQKPVIPQNPSSEKNLVVIKAKWC